MKLIHLVAICLCFISVFGLSVDKLKDEIVKSRHGHAHNSHTKSKAEFSPNKPPPIHEHDYVSVVFEHEMPQLCCGPCPGRVYTEYVAKACITDRKAVLKPHFQYFKTIKVGGGDWQCAKSYNDVKLETEKNLFGACGIEPADPFVRNNLPDLISDARFEPHDSL